MGHRNSLIYSLPNVHITERKSWLKSSHLYQYQPGMYKYGLEPTFYGGVPYKCAAQPDVDGQPVYRSSPRGSNDAYTHDNVSTMQ